MKKTFYNWAKMVYTAALRHAVPIPSANQRAPRSLYHGLSRLFAVTQELPIYFGPFSSTLTVNVAGSFSGESGLIFTIQPSYSNAESCVIGIDMAKISVFKNENEILLVNRVIPIQKAKTKKDNDDKVWVDHFLFTLKARSTEVVEEEVFFKKLGEKWTVSEPGKRQVSMRIFSAALR